MQYLLGTPFFIDSGHQQVKMYPEPIVHFLAARHLNKRIRSPEDAQKLASSLTWQASTGECGVYKAFLPLAGWLATLNAHWREVLRPLDPQAVAFFGDLRHSCVPLADAEAALSAAVERLAEGDKLGRNQFTLTTENYWQAGKAGIETALKSLFAQYGTDILARPALLNIATYSRLDQLRPAVLALYQNDYAQLLGDENALAYILALGQAIDLVELAQQLLASSTKLKPAVVADLLTELAWKHLDAAGLAKVMTEQFEAGRTVSSNLLKSISDGADTLQLLPLSRTMLTNLTQSSRRRGLGLDQEQADRAFAEYVADLLAVLIERNAAGVDESANLCSEFQQHLSNSHYFRVDTQGLRKALQDNPPVRLLLIRCLIAEADNAGGNLRSLIFPGRIFPLLEDDVPAVNEPRFTQLVTSVRVVPEALGDADTHAEIDDLPSRARPLLSDADKDTLQHNVDRLQNNSDPNLLVGVTDWLGQHAHSQGSHLGRGDLSLLEQWAGNEVAAAVRTGLQQWWRQQEPIWKEEEPTSVYRRTTTGLVGLHLELGDGCNLPELAEDEVRRAIHYARFEINGYPDWFWPLVQRYELLAGEELAGILQRAGNGKVSRRQAETLIWHLPKASSSVQSTLGPHVWDFLRSHDDLDADTTAAALHIAINCHTIDQTFFEAAAKHRIEQVLWLTESDEDQPSQHPCRRSAVLWGESWLWHFPDSFSTYWETWQVKEPAAAKRFMFELAAYLGNDFSRRLGPPGTRDDDSALPLQTLKRLYQWICQVVREEDDLVRDGVYTPAARDHAEHLRNRLPVLIAAAKTEAAYAILRELYQQAHGIQAKHLYFLMRQLREEQLTRPPLSQQDYPKFVADLCPAISDFTSFALAVQSDLLSVKRQIETGDFSLRRFFSAVNFRRINTDKDGLALEADFQILLGSELNHAAAGRYTVTLESTLPNNTRRDVLCQHGQFRATIELKMSEHWTLAHYMTALEQQLVGQYMQDLNSTIGFLVVVLQKDRQWDAPEGGRIGFAEVIDRLKEKARALESANGSMFLRVIGMDATEKPSFRGQEKRTRSGRQGPPTQV